MLKKSILALATAAVLASAVPASAVGVFGDGTPEQRERRAGTILTMLRDHGVEAVRVEEWGDLIRAYVRQPDGGTKMQFYRPHSYEPVVF